MKKLQKSDLKEGEIYICIIPNMDIKFLIKKTGSLICNNIEISPLKNELFIDGGFNGLNNQFFEATPEEKHWLETCIKADQFVSYEEAMKTFIPEYYEYVGDTNLYNTEFIKGKTYKIVNKNDLEDTFNFINEKGEANGWSGSNWEYFKPSTKEAYDAQFVVKEPKFVLPEKWCIRITENNINILKSYYIEQNYKDLDFTGWMLSDCGYDGTGVNWYRGDCHIGGNGYLLKYTEITFEQFKKYVLKEQLEEPKDKVLEKEGIDLNIGKIIRVECSEGGVYRIGDKIKVFDKYSPNKGKVFTIKSFRWTNDKSKICAVTELHTPNGIGLDKIELYVEPKVKQELSLLEQAKLKYPIGTKIISPTSKSTHIIKGGIRYGYQNTSVCNYIFGNDGGCTLYNANTNQWAEIVDDFVLPEKWCVGVNEELRNRLNYCEVYGYHHSIQINDTNKWSNKIKEGFTEITFEQFKKYVLKDE